MRSVAVRSVGLLALVAGLALSGCGGGGAAKGTAAKTAEGTAPQAKPVVLARVGSGVITSKTLDDRVKQLPPFAQSEYKSDSGRRNLLDRMVEEELMYQAAVDAGLANDPETADKIRENRRRTLVEAYYTRFVQDAAKMAPADVEKYYKEHPSEFTDPEHARVRHILLKSEGEAKKLRERILSGGTQFETAARELSTDTTTKLQAGLIPGDVAAGKPVGSLGVLPEFVAAAMALKPGEVSQPVKTKDGWHLIKLEEKKPSRVRTLDEVRDQIEAQGSGDRVRAKFKEKMDELHAKYKVQLAEGMAQDTTQVTAESLFQQAQQTTDPAARIVAYQRILKEFPGDKHCYEAQFMIGFVYSEDLKDYTKAKDAFELVLKNYPSCELAESARWMIGNMHQDTPSFLQEKPGAAGAKPPLKKTG